ncbi:uncharacterized protein LOC106130550 [Amyelois transitella]|uniref:uncharacterized protein LOC106130550 n=1 Tax=Amyelois transitella TaxID=680683 RepID=UPI0029904D2B|nr:uncharacterized protein LOC106130550 [Amyelois transitella]
MSTMISLMMFLCACACARAAPADDPIRVDLPVYDQPQSGSDVYLARPLLPENYDYPKKDNSIVGNLLSHKLNGASTILSSSNVKSGSLNIQGSEGWFAPPVTSLEGALLETEGVGSKALSVKDNLHSIVAGILQPKPIVDTIKEEEKYGNSGDRFYSAGRALVGGAEGVSNFVNSIIEVPGSILRKITKAASEKLNNLGGRLIGL